MAICVMNVQHEMHVMCWDCDVRRVWWTCDMRCMWWTCDMRRVLRLLHDTCILVWWKIKKKSVHTSVREVQVTDVCTGHQTGFIVWEQGRQLVSTFLLHIICCIELCEYLKYKLSIIHHPGYNYNLCNVCFTRDVHWLSIIWLFPISH